MPSHEEKRQFQLPKRNYLIASAQTARPLPVATSRAGSGSGTWRWIRNCALSNVSRIAFAPTQAMIPLEA